MFEDDKIVYAWDDGEDHLAQFMAFRKVGEKFNYLGVTFIVINHYEDTPSNMCFSHTDDGDPIFTFVKLRHPRIMAEYHNTVTGMFNSKEFYINLLPILIEENKHAISN